jgi:RNA polymerase sigma factor (sigma-70 family)
MRRSKERLFYLRTTAFYANEGMQGTPFLFLLGYWEGIKMEFSELFKRIASRVRIIARKYRCFSPFFNEEDLYQEMCMYLWSTFKDGAPPHLNDAYIVRGCEFHILNYLRKEREKIRKVSLDEEINEQGESLKDVLVTRGETMDVYLDKKLTIEYILNNGFSRREKEVFSLLIKGHTVREAGSILGISHVMVVKLKNRLIEKYQKNMKKVTKNSGSLLN